MRNSFETIVVGLGAMGSAVAYQLAKRGSKVLGIDRFSPPHPYGSSHGETRLTRQAIGEGAEYMPLILRSYELWDEIEQETGREILTVTGGLILTSVDRGLHHGSYFFDQTVACAEQYHIAHQLLDGEEIKRRFPPFQLTGRERGYFEDRMGYVRPERAIEAQLELAGRHGALLAFNERVLNVSVRGKGEVVVKTDKDEYEAEKIIVSAGPWVAELLGPSFEPYFSVYRQVQYWFDVEAPISQFSAPAFPVWIWEFGTAAADIMYGFPAIDGAQGGIKIASEQYDSTTVPESASGEVTAHETRAMYQRYVRPHFEGIGEKCVRAVACLYTVTPDHRFVIDLHPDFPEIIVASPCSGHGFKHSAAIGEALAQMVTEGQSQIDLSPFRFGRFADK